MSDIKAFSTLIDSLDGSYLNSALDRIRSSQDHINKLYSDTVLERIQTTYEYIRELYSDSTLERIKRAQEDLNSLCSPAILSAFESAATRLATINLPDTFISSCLDLTNKSIQFLEDVDNSEDSVGLMREYISSTETSLDNLQETIPETSRKDPFILRLFEEIKSFLSSFNISKKIPDAATILIGILSLVVTIYLSQQSAITANENTDRLIEAIAESADQISDSIDNLSEVIKD